MTWHRDPDPDARRAQDLFALRKAAWLLKQDRYRAERPKLERGHRGKADIVVLTLYFEAADWREADAAVKEIEGRARGAGDPGR